MSDRPVLHYVHGYGFCLTTADGKKHPLKLDGDGERNDSKQLLIDTFNTLRQRLATVEKELAEARKRIRVWEDVKETKRSVEELEHRLVDAFWERNMIGQQLTTVEKERDELLNSTDSLGILCGKQRVVVEVAYDAGWADGVRLYAVWKDGEQLVGVMRRPLKTVLAEGSQSDHKKAALAALDAKEKSGG